MVHKEARRQVCFTLLGAGTILLSFVVVGTAFVANFLSKQDALDRKAQCVKKGFSDLVMHEVALGLTEAYATARRLAEQASLGRARKDRVWPPTRESFVDSYEHLLANLWIQLETDLHLREVEPTGRAKEIIPLLGLSAVVALQQDARTFASSMEECVHVLRVAIYASEDECDGDFRLSDSPRKLAHRTQVVTNQQGAEETRLELRHFHVGNYSLLPEVLGEADGPGCEQMRELWGDTPTHPAFGNFSWFGPTLDGPVRRAMHGDAPLYSEDGRRKIGFASSIFSVEWQVRAVLPTIIKNGGDVLDGAEIAVISEFGLLLGASEFEVDQMGHFDSLSDIPEGSSLGRALGSVRRAAGGVVCPPECISTGEDERIINSCPFSTESHGLPPLNERWCVIQITPRQNIFGALDNIQQIKIMTGSFLLVLVSCSIVLFATSLYLALAADRSLRTEKLKADLHQVVSAVQDVHTLNSPMVLISAGAFLELAKLQHYEALRDEGVVTVLDSLSAIASFKEKNLIVFLSHQWLSLDFPDVEEGVQLEAMKGAIRTVLGAPGRKKDVYIWCDFISIAQRHTKMQRASIGSLPTYARVADKFIMVAPSVVHADSDCQCNFDSYRARGWCRAEILAKACGDGIKDMYTCTGANGTLFAITVEDLSWLSLNVFAGHFTYPEDAEDLVKPVLGLYSLVLRQRHLPHMAVLHDHIEKDKAAFFPRSYHSARRGEEVELFGGCVELLEAYVAQGNASRAGVTQPTGSM